MVNLLPGPTRDFMALGRRIAQALERIADAAENPPTRKSDNYRAAAQSMPNMNPEVGVHAQLGCELLFNSRTRVWCNTHDVELPLVLGPVVPPLTAEQADELRAKLAGEG